MEYHKNPQLPFLPAQADRAGNPFSGKEYRYEQDEYRPDWSAVLKMIFSSNPQRAEKKADKWVPEVSQGVSYLGDKDKDWVVWLGHACFLIQLNGVRILTDPQLRDMPLVPRRVHPPFGYDELKDIDYLLLSHDHRDHVDQDCIRTIVANNMLEKILCPLGLAKTIQPWVDAADDRRGYQQTIIEEAAWYQIYDTGSDAIRITFLPSQHWCRRGLFDLNRSLWGSFMIESTVNRALSRDAEQVGKTGPAPTELATIYFGGDSAKTTYWKEIGELFPKIDLALLGIGAYSPAFMMQDVHANPEEAFQGFLDLGAHYWWPMHHGTYDLSNEPAGEPFRRAEAAMEGAGLADRLVRPVINRPFIIG